MNIRVAIRALSARWINPTYAAAINVPQQVEHLCVHAFVNQIPEGEDTALVREAWKRLHASALDGEWTP